MIEIINLKNVSLTRSGRKVLSRMNWVTYKGEHWFIMGPNGSGKTTLVEILMGYLWPQKGEVRVLGEVFGRTNLQELRTKVGYVSPWIFRRMPPETPVEDVVASGFDSSVGFFGRQTPAIIPDFAVQNPPRAEARGRAGKLDKSFPGFAGSSQIFPALKCARQNPGLPCKAGKSSSDLPHNPFGANFSIEKFGIKRAVLRQLRFSGCLSLKDRAFGMISSGQQFKVILARALVHQPALLILDEPFSLLDIGARMEMYRLLTQLAKGPRAPQLLLVTHHREDLLPVFDRGLILKNGRIHRQGRRADVLAPLNLSSAFGIPVDTVRGAPCPLGRRRGRIRYHGPHEERKTG